MSKKIAAFIGKIGFLVAIFGGVFFPSPIKAANQVCKIGSSCVLGEFLYDDNYTPINSDVSCKLTSRRPNGTIFLNEVSLSIGTSDGWYSYSVDTSSQDEGLYPSQICCTIGVGTTEYMCLDKTFQLEVANLTSLGTLTDDVSSIKSTVNSIETKVNSLDTKINTIDTNVTSTLNKWGSYSAADILTNVNKVMTGIGTTADTCVNNSVLGNIACIKDKWGSQTAQGLYDAANGALNIGTSLRVELSYNGKSTTAYEDLQTIKNYVNGLNINVGQSSDLSTDLTLFGKIKANKDKIDNVSVGISNVQTTVNSIETKINALDLKMTNIGATVSLILTKWGSYSASDLITNINSINLQIGTSGDSCSVNSVFGNITCVRDKWGSQTAQSLYDAANGALNIGTSLRAELNYNGKSTTAYADMQTLKGYVDSLETNIGENTDSSSATTLFGKIKGNKEDIAGVQTTVNSIVTSLSTLVYDVWHYTERALTGFGTLVASIWSNPNRTLTSANLDSGELATNQSIGSSLSGIQSSLNSIESKINSLDTKIGTIGTKTDTLISKWGSSSVTDILTSISSNNLNIGTTADTCVNNSVLGNIACIKDKWGSQTAQNLYDAANGALNIGNSLRVELSYNGKSTTAYEDLQTIKNYVDILESKVGDSSDLASATTLFGKVKSNKDDITGVSGQVAGVQTSIDSINIKVDSLNTKADTVSGNITSLLNKWGSYSIADVLNNINGIDDVLGTTSDTCIGSNSIYGQIACVNDKWGDQTAATLYTATNNAATIISSLRSELNYTGKSTTAYEDLVTLKSNINSLQNSIGDANDSATATTIFGKIKKIQSVVEVLTGTGVEVDEVIDKWGTLSAADIYDKVKNLSSEISAVNTVSNVSSILTLNQNNSTDMIALKNQVLALKALIDVNQTLLEKSVNKPIIKSWLEEGSIIFKTMITNPSSVRQSVPLKFYLPKEVAKKDIMNIDSEVKVEYDTNEEAFYITGDFSLAPNQTKIVVVEVTDIWKIAQTEINSLELQTNELSKPLEKTAYFAQGVTLKSDILAQLENINRIQKEAITPEAKIQAYRENLISLNRVKNEVKDLQSLVSSLSSTNTLTGFIGGAQTTSLWGIILVIVIGIVGLFGYVKILIIKTKNKSCELVDKKIEKKRFNVINRQNLRLVGVIALLIVSSGISAKLTWIGLDKFFTKKIINTSLLKVEEIKRNETIAQITPVTTEAVLGVQTDEKIIEKINLVLPKESTSSVKVRSEANLDSEILGKIWANQSVDKYEEKDDWTKIGINLKIDGVEKYITGWIRSQFVENNVF